MTNSSSTPRRVSKSYMVGFSSKPFKDPPTQERSPPSQKALDQVLRPGSWLEWIASDGRKGKLTGSVKTRSTKGKEHKTKMNKSDDNAADETGWTKAEDEKLLAWKAENPNGQWALIGEELGKDKSLCKARFNEIKNKDEKPSDTAKNAGGAKGKGDKEDADNITWTQAEDEALMAWKSENPGGNWASIGTQLGKPNNACKTRFNVIKPKDWTPANVSKKDQSQKNNNNSNSSPNANNNMQKKEEKKEKGSSDAGDPLGGFGGLWGNDDKQDNAGDEQKDNNNTWNQDGNNNPWGQGGDDNANNNGTAWATGGDGGAIGDAWKTDLTATAGGGNNWEASGDLGGGGDPWSTQANGGGDTSGGAAWNNPVPAATGDQDQGAWNTTNGATWNATATQNDPTKPASKAHSHRSKNKHKHSSSHEKRDEKGHSKHHDKHDEKRSKDKHAPSGTVELEPDDIFSADDLKLVAKLLQQDNQLLWDRVSWRFRDKTGRNLKPEVFEKKIMAGIKE